MGWLTMRARVLCAREKKERKVSWKSFYLVAQKRENNLYIGTLENVVGKLDG